MKKSTAVYSLPIVGLSILLLFSQTINLEHYYQTFKLLSNRSLQSVPSPSETSSQCLLSTPRFKGIKVYSQNDEDGILIHLLRCTGGFGTKEFFEFGAHDGMQVNTRVLRQHYGWKGHLLDGGFDKPEINLHQEYFTPSNIVQLLQKYGASKTLDVLSVDTDCDDFWVTREILVAGYQPRILIQEYNQHFDSLTAVSALPKEIGKEKEDHCWGMYHGASALAFHRLLSKFGYTLVYANGVNLFFVRNDIAINHGLELPSYNDVALPLEKKNMAALDGPFQDPLTRDRSWALIDYKAVHSLHNRFHSHESIVKMMKETSVKIKTIEQAYYRFFEVQGENV